MKVKKATLASASRAVLFSETRVRSDGLLWGGGDTVRPPPDGTTSRCTLDALLSSGGTDIITKNRERVGGLGFAWVPSPTFKVGVRSKLVRAKLGAQKMHARMASFLLTLLLSTFALADSCSITFPIIYTGFSSSGQPFNDAYNISSLGMPS